MGKLYVTEKARLVNAKEMYDNNDYRVIWDSDNGRMFAWELELEMNGQTVLVKAFTKKENPYSLNNGTDIVFETTWDESKGLPYAKKVKDVNSQYAKSGGSSQQNTNRPTRSDNRGPKRGGESTAQAPQSQRPQKAPVAPEGLSSKQVHYQAQMIAIKYLEEASKRKELQLNMETINGMGNMFTKWVIEKENKSAAIKALNVCAETSKLNSVLVEEEAINTSNELLTLAETYYSMFA